jgi:hypothetical protein
MDEGNKPAKQAYELRELTALGYGSHAYLYLEMGRGRLRAVKRGRRTIVLDKDLKKWRSEFPDAKISPPKPKPEQQAA